MTLFKAFMEGRDEALRAELLGMAEEDRRLRAELAADGTLFDEGYHPSIEALHRSNGERLAAILDVYGWPGASLVGEDGARAAFVVAQHAISLPDVQRRALELLREAVSLHDARAAFLAMLEDRIATLEGRPQRYGTQLDWDEDGQLSPLPVDEPGEVDRRRAAVGLPPLADTVRAMRAHAAREGARPPGDARARRAAMDAWARSIGWRR